MVSVSAQGFLSFPNPVPVCYSPTLEVLQHPAAQCPYPPHEAPGTGVSLFYGYTTQLVGSGATQYYGYYSACPYPGLAEVGCYIFQYNQSQWQGYNPSFATTAEVIFGQNGAVILQWNTQNPNYWLGALFGVATTSGLGAALSYPQSGSSSCPWGNYTDPLSLAGKAVAFYPATEPIPCDSTHNITFANSSGRGCTCEDFDQDGYVCPEHDACPFDPNKWLSPGVCGCGVPDIDSDGDGYDNCIDACPYDPHKWLSPGLCGCGNPDYLPGSYSLACGTSSSTASVLSSWLALLE